MQNYTLKGRNNGIFRGKRKPERKNTDSIFVKVFDAPPTNLGFAKKNPGRGDREAMQKAYCKCDEQPE
jgi:hypothetical protein